MALRTTRFTHPVTTATVASLLCLSTDVFAQARPATAPQAAGAAEARAHFDAGVAASNQGRWQEALREFELARASQATAPVLYNLGLAQRAVGRVRDARATFRELIEQHGPRLSAERRTELQGYVTELDASVGRLELTVNPPGATVTVDGATVTERAIELDPGRHEVVVESAGHRRATRAIELRRGGSATVDITLEREEIRRRITVEVDEPSASVRLDGRAIGRGAAEGEVSPGAHELEVSAVGFRPYRQSVRVDAADVRVRVTLERLAQAQGTSPWVWVGVGVGSAAVIGGLVALGVVLGTTVEDPYRGSWNTVAQGLDNPMGASR
jgi:hypothetical protein